MELTPAKAYKSNYMYPELPMAMSASPPIPADWVAAFGVSWGSATDPLRPVEYSLTIW